MMIATASSSYQDSIDASHLLLPKTKNETFKVVLRASTHIVVSILLPNFTPFPELVAQMPKEEVQVFVTLVLYQCMHLLARGADMQRRLTCGKASLKVWYRSSTVGFSSAFVIFELNRSRYLRMYARSSFGSSSQPDSIWPAIIFVG